PDGAMRNEKGSDDGNGSKITVFFAATTVPQSGEDRKSLHKFQTPAKNVVCAPNTGKANLGFKTGKIDPERTFRDSESVLINSRENL
ncbi:MAG: hypothetical protein ACO3U3_08410, partial [Alphaproteobacteria bacterium]